MKLLKNAPALLLLAWIFATVFFPVRADADPSAAQIRAALRAGDPAVLQTITSDPVPYFGIVMSIATAVNKHGELLAVIKFIGGIDATDAAGHTLLIDAARYGDVPECRWLIQHGASTSAGGASGDAYQWMTRVAPGKDATFLMNSGDRPQQSVAAPAPPPTPPGQIYKDGAYIGFVAIDQGPAPGKRRSVAGVLNRLRTRCVGTFTNTSFRTYRSVTLHVEFVDARLAVVDSETGSAANLRAGATWKVSIPARADTKAVSALVSSVVVR